MKYIIYACKCHNGKRPGHFKPKSIGHLISVLFWSCALIVGFILATIMIRISWNKFEAQPTITTITTAVHPIWHLPFPAVTVCNTNKVYAPAASKFTRLLLARGLTAERAEEFLSLLQTLTTMTGTLETDTFDDAFHAVAIMNYTIERIMHELMVPCAEMFAKCWWRGEEQPCGQLFRVSTASDGFCCAFNFKPPLDASLV